jgi:hypothetical protein
MIPLSWPMSHDRQMVHAASAQPPARPATGRRPDQVVELRTQLWRLHSELDSLDAAGSAYDAHAERILMITEAFMTAVEEQRKPESRRSWLPPLPRLAADAEMRRGRR